MPDLSALSFARTELRDLYRAQALSVAEVVREALRRATQPEHPHVWSTLLSEEQIMSYVERLPFAKLAELPLFGLPFAIKDNIDLEGVPTTCACPAFAYTPHRSATVVERLIQAGAIPIGKTNLDQFATGLNGTRSPYGAPQSVFDARYISGGSSSGSAVAVASGQVTFALGTDTAGSGRVPAAFNNLVGLKPTRGVLSTTGLVPACRSLDCLSIFALSSIDAQAVFQVAAQPDATDPYSRKLTQRALSSKLRYGVPRPNQMEFFGDTAAAQLFAEACVRLEQLGAEKVEVDFTPFQETAALLYAGPWVAERTWAVGDFLEKHGEAMDPTVRTIIAQGKNYSAVQTFAALYKLQELKNLAQQEWAKMDVLLLPTAGTTYTIEALRQDPVALNSNLGRYTNFVNLLDLAAVAVPAGFTPAGLPFGVTLMAPAQTDHALLILADQFHKALGGNLGATAVGIASQPAPISFSTPRVEIAVVGAHLQGQPLHHQLTSRRAEFVAATETAPYYRLYHLAETVPPKPGLVRGPERQVHGIKIEVWSLDFLAFGEFVAEVPPPLAIGTVELADGRSVKGFVCEPGALVGSKEITEYGGWVAYQKEQA